MNLYHFLSETNNDIEEIVDHLTPEELSEMKQTLHSRVKKTKKKKIPWRVFISISAVLLFVVITPFGQSVLAEVGEKVNEWTEKLSYFAGTGSEINKYIEVVDGSVQKGKWKYTVEKAIWEDDKLLLSSNIEYSGKQKKYLKEEADAFAIIEIADEKGRVVSFGGNSTGSEEYVAKGRRWNNVTSYDLKWKETGMKPEKLYCKVGSIFINFENDKYKNISFGGVKIPLPLQDRKDVAENFSWKFGEVFGNLPDGREVVLEEIKYSLLDSKIGIASHEKIDDYTMNIVAIDDFGNVGSYTGNIFLEDGYDELLLRRGSDIDWKNTQHMTLKLMANKVKKFQDGNGGSWDPSQSIDIGEITLDLKTGKIIEKKLP